MSPEGPTADEVRAALNRVLASEAFRGARRSTDLLRYVVETSLASPGQPIKEYALGAEALGRGEKFDPRFDPIARVEASRVRTRLSQYYATDGAADSVRIALPKGGYTPAFRRDEQKFSHFDQAERWIERNVSKLKRVAGRRK